MPENGDTDIVRPWPSLWPLDHLSSLTGHSPSYTMNNLVLILVDTSVQHQGWSTFANSSPSLAVPSFFCRVNLEKRPAQAWKGFQGLWVGNSEVSYNRSLVWGAGGKPRLQEGTPTCLSWLLTLSSHRKARTGISTEWAWDRGPSWFRLMVVLNVPILKLRTFLLRSN